MSAKTYKLLGGMHRDKEGTVYHRGDTVVSEEDLVAKFPNKFEVTEDTSKPTNRGTGKPVFQSLTEKSSDEDEPHPENAHEPEEDGGDPGQADEDGKPQLKASQNGKPEDGGEESEVASTDVTKQFLEAVEADLVVLKSDKGWQVFDDDVAVNEKPCRKKDVSDVIYNYLHGEE